MGKLKTAGRIIAILILAVSGSVFAQARFPKPPANYAKIRFTYMQQSSLHFDANGIYADTLFLRGYFPDHKWQVLRLPADPKSVVGFIPIQALTEKDKSVVVGIISHATFKISGVYDKKKNRTRLYYHRPDKDTDVTRSRLKAVFGKTYSDYAMQKKCYDYQTNEFWSETKFSTCLEDIDVQKNQIHWVEGKENLGMFDDTIKGFTFRCAAVVDSDLARHVTPVLLFGNCESGVAKVETVAYTQELVSVSYE
jgi:hypothetical protein